MKTLSPREQKCLVFLKAYMRDNGIAPTYAEIAAAIGIKAKSNALYVVDALVGAGFVQRVAKRARGLKLLPTEDHHAADCVCDGCAKAFYLRSLQLVHALKVSPPAWFCAVIPTGIKPLGALAKKSWVIGFPYSDHKRAKPRVKAAQ